VPQFRLPSVADYAELASWIGNATDCARWAGPQLPFPFTVAALSELLQVAEGESWAMADAAGRLLGFGQFWLRPTGTVHLGRIIISPHWRGHGGAKALCSWLMATARERHGERTVTLRVYRDNPAALRTYLQLGFTAVEPESDTEILFMQRAV